MRGAMAKVSLGAGVLFLAACGLPPGEVEGQDESQNETVADLTHTSCDSGHCSDGGSHSGCDSGVCKDGGTGEQDGGGAACDGGEHCVADAGTDGGHHSRCDAGINCEADAGSEDGGEPPPECDGGKCPDGGA